MFKEIQIKNKKGLKLSAVIGIPDKNKKSPAIILLHGFTGYKAEEHILSLSKFLTQNGYVTIRFDSSGFGESEGSTEKEYRVSNYVKDIECVYNYLLKQKFVDKNRMGVWGQSMGGMLSIIFGSKHPEIKAVCAVSTPTQITRADALEGWLREWKEKGSFDKWSSKYGQVKIPYAFVEDSKQWSALDSIKLINAPTLIILGTIDDTVLPNNTRQVFQSANKPKELFEVDKMNHDYKKNPAQIKIVNNKVLKFFNRYL